jgi:hypothetical protein
MVLAASLSLLTRPSIVWEMPDRLLEAESPNEVKAVLTPVSAPEISPTAEAKSFGPLESNRPAP